MLRRSPGPSAEAKKALTLLVFSVGGRRMAVKAEEVGGVWPWTQAMPVPSATAFVGAVFQRGDEVLPVFDLAGRLNVQVQGQAPLCLIGKHRLGPFAMRIDAQIPTLVAVDQAAFQPGAGPEPEVEGRCVIDTEELAVVSLGTLLRSPRPQSPAVGPGDREEFGTGESHG
ncbi:MAG: chemotaxis protein CheW [Nitrospiraceae bacterium]